MEISNEKFEELIARRLISQVEGDVKQNASPAHAAETVIQLEPTDGQISPTEPDFIKIEKNLASLGFFTPSTKKIKNVKEKTISFTRIVDGNKVEACVTIIPTAKYGLPITADQDTYLALFKLATEMQRHQGRVTNPIGFTSAEILRLQDKSPVSGFHYKELFEQLMRIKTTTIMSEGAVWLAGRKVWAKDAFNVLDRVVFFGKELPDGTIADKNYVWLSEWQLENINNNYLLPIDFDTYKKLKNHIAKALVPLLQIWLYASREEGCFEKRYDELCQVLNVRQYHYLSEIKRNFTPSLDELKAHDYLADWKIEKTSDKKAYKIIFYHGEKFHRDRRRRLKKKEAAALPPAQEPPATPQSQPEQGSAAQPLPPERSEKELAFIRQLNEQFGVIILKADELVQRFPDETERQLEAWPYRTDENVREPAGFIIRAIEQGFSLPKAYLEAKEQATAREKAAAAAKVKAQVEAEQARQEAAASARDEARLAALTEADRAVLQAAALERIRQNPKFRWLISRGQNSAMFLAVLQAEMLSLLDEQEQGSDPSPESPPVTVP